MAGCALKPEPISSSTSRKAQPQLQIRARSSLYGSSSTTLIMTASAGDRALTVATRLLLLSPFLTLCLMPNFGAHALPASQTHRHHHHRHRQPFWHHHSDPLPPVQDKLALPQGHEQPVYLNLGGLLDRSEQHADVLVVSEVHVQPTGSASPAKLSSEDCKELSGVLSIFPSYIASVCSSISSTVATNMLSAPLDLMRDIVDGWHRQSGDSSSRNNLGSSWFPGSLLSLHASVSHETTTFSEPVHAHSEKLDNSGNVPTANVSELKRRVEGMQAERGSRREGRRVGAKEGKPHLYGHLHPHFGRAQRRAGFVEHYSSLEDPVVRTGHAGQ
ncbi:hypothetical protein VTK73DRAFT_5868 [Phialemonium thermophilum]|uniref:Uncharacterized protein n=1 Tax=Phialemonium thermophilum TaxID=223376 RepID=A0ABR3XXV8_9PEZI